MRNRTHSDEEIINAVKDSHSFAETLSLLRSKSPGGNYHTMKRRIDFLSLDTSHFTGQLWSKGKTIISDPRVSKRKMEDVFCENSISPRSYVRSIVIKEKLIEYKCEKCKTGKEWQGEAISLQLDHKNGKGNDHRIENLRFLCPNCHSQTPTFCKRDKSRKKVTDKEILEASAGCTTIRRVMVKLGMDNGRNYHRFNKVLPHLVKK